MNNEKYNGFQNMLERLLKEDLFDVLEKNILPSHFLPSNRYDEVLLETGLGYVMNDPMFIDWRHTLKLQGEMQCVRSGEDTPVIETGYNLSIDEVRALRLNHQVLLTFMRSMARALCDRALPYDEVFACILDAVYTQEHVMSSRLENIH